MLLGILCAIFIALNLVNLFMSFPNVLFTQSALFIICLLIAIVLFATPNYIWGSIYLVMGVVWFFMARKTYKLIVKLDKMFK